MLWHVLLKCNHLNSRSLPLQVTVLAAEIKKSLTATDAPLFLQLFQQANTAGLFKDRKALVDVLDGMATALVKGSRKRHLGTSTKAFYVSLLNYGGPLVHNLVANLLLGPSLRTSQRTRAKFHHYSLGIEAASFANAANILRLFSLSELGC